MLKKKMESHEISDQSDRSGKSAFSADVIIVNDMHHCSISIYFYIKNGINLELFSYYF